MKLSVFAASFAVVLALAPALAQKVGQPAPDFRLYDTAGKVVRLADLRGKPVVLNFWATWCPTCRAEFPHLQSTFGKLGDRVRFLAVNLNEPPADAAAFMKANGYSFRTLVNPPSGANGVDDTVAVARRYRVIGQPVTVFVDARGTVRATHQGYLDEAGLARYLALVGLR